MDMVLEEPQLVRWLGSQMFKTRAAFMAKDKDGKRNPLAYGVLLMVPATYSLLVETRLRHLRPWIDGWAMPEMSARVEGRGAEDAAYSISLLLEHANSSKALSVNILRSPGAH